MAHVSRSKASLRIIGDSLNPSEISKLLGREGTTMYAKGEIYKIKATGRTVTRKSGHWSLSARAHEPEDIDGQAKEILDQLTDDLDIWTSYQSPTAVTSSAACSCGRVTRDWTFILQR